MENKNKKYTTAEKQIIKNDVLSYGVEAVAKRLKRTPAGVHRQARKMGIKLYARDIPEIEFQAVESTFDPICGPIIKPIPTQTEALDETDAELEKQMRPYWYGFIAVIIILVTLAVGISIGKFGAI